MGGSWRKNGTGESIRESVIREYSEETGIYLRQPVKGIFTFVIKDGAETVSEWMMFTFIANSETEPNLTNQMKGAFMAPNSKIERTAYGRR